MQLKIILGGGESGTGAALLAKAKGFNVFLSDGGILNEKYKAALTENNIEFEEGAHNLEKIYTASEVIKSPGIPEKAEIVKKIREKGIPIISEIEFASRYTQAKIIGITGSNGKTTTSLLTYHILKTAGLNVGLAGNIGDSFARQVLEKNYDWYVLEISSFQLDDCYHFNPYIAILTNITPDHLDRYDYKFENYINSKFRIVQNQTGQDYFIFFQDNEPLLAETGKRNIKSKLLPVSFTNKNAAVFINYEKQVLIFDNNIELPLASLPIKGPHNALNSAFAIIIAKLAGLSIQQVSESLQNFEGPPHRLEFVATIKGTDFINDSKATNVDSVFYALSSFAQPIILIIGGVDKGNDYMQIEALVKNKVKAIICLGLDNKKLINFFKGKVPVIVEANKMKDAVSLAYDMAESGDVALLSPACASFDLFKNYEDRGNQFKEAVKKLI